MHTLLYQHGLTKKWSDQGVKWVVLFQDTNPLIFRAVLPVVGVSAEQNF